MTELEDSHCPDSISEWRDTNLSSAFLVQVEKCAFGKKHLAKFSLSHIANLPTGQAGRQPPTCLPDRQVANLTRM